MNSYYHKYVKITIEDDVFDEIVQIANSNTNFRPSEASTYDGQQYIKDLGEYRQSKFVVVKNENLNDIIETIIRNINIQADWNFHLSALEEVQHLRYDVGDYFKWHVDEADWTPGKRPYNLMRKISYSIILNDDYTGGEFDMFSTKELKFNLKKKDMIVFHSDIMHQVKPIISGTRYSLVGWVLGPPWR